jgi:hypothetical protein
MFDLLRFLFNHSSEAERQRERCLDYLLQAYHEEARAAKPINELERELRVRLRILPVLRTNEEFALTLEAAIISLRSWLLAFGAAALILLSLSAGLRYYDQSPIGLDEAVTYNADPTHRDPFLISDEIDNGH